MIVEYNYRDFRQEKDDDLEAHLPEEPSKKKGWGNWTGPGIT